MARHSEEFTTREVLLTVMMTFGALGLGCLAARLIASSHAMSTFWTTAVAAVCALIVLVAAVFHRFQRRP
jgi:hypothetical protein